MAQRKKNIPSRGTTMDVKPPKDFQKKSEADFAAEEEQIIKEVEAETGIAIKKARPAKKAPVKKSNMPVMKPAPTAVAQEDDLENLINEEISLEELSGDKEEESTIFAKKKVKKSAIRTISRVFAILATIVNLLFLQRLLAAQVLPAKYAYPLIAVIAIITLFYIFKAFRKKTHKTVLIILDILAVILSAGFVFATVKINEVFGFLDKNFNSNKQTAMYNVVVNKDSSYNALSDLKDKPIISYEELVKDISDDELRAKVKESIPGATISFDEDIDRVMNSIVSSKTAAILVNSGTYGAYIDNDSSYEGKVKIIGTIEVEISGETISVQDKDLTNSPFILFINGIDTRTDKMPTRSLSDVNIIAAVNPNTRKITMITTPRDYYVQLHGTAGLKDKLTHAGSKGGVKLSQATLEDFYDIKIDRYIRVNFNFVKKLVDAVGGITVNNDVSTTIITAKTNYGKQCTFKPGDNEVNGDCALSFARERHAYKDGDRHRGRNQMHVIEQIIKKVTSASTLLAKYGEIMKSLEGTFDSNISTEDITSLVRMQLDDMRSWSIDSYSVNGKGLLTKTYSYPNQNLYVMEPDINTVETAKQKIQATLAE